MLRKILFLVYIICFVPLIFAQETELVLKKALPDHESDIENDYLVHPYDLKIFDGFFIVNDAEDCCLKIFSETGEFIRKIGKRGQGPGEINTAFRITIDQENGIIYCNDIGNGRITSFYFDGKYKSMIRTLLPPFNIEYFDGSLHTSAYNRANKSLFAMYNSEGVLIKTYGDIFDNNIPDTRFTPDLYQSVNFDKDSDYLYVLYDYIPYIDIYSRKGELIRRIFIEIKEIKDLYHKNIKGVKQDLVNRLLKVFPWNSGGCVNNKLYYYLSKVHSNVILVLDANGEFLKKVPFQDKEDRSMYRFITLLNGKYIFVDIGSAQVKIYEEVQR